MKKYLLILLLSLVTRTEAIGKYFSFPETEATPSNNHRSDFQALDNLQWPTHRNQSSQSRMENAHQVDPLERELSRRQDEETLRSHQEETNFKISMKIMVMGAVAAVGLIWLLLKRNKESTFKDVKQTLTTAKKHTAELEALERELTTRALSNYALIVTLFKQCNVKRLTRELETAAPLVNTKMKQEWTTLLTAHEKFLDAWKSISRILNSANQETLNGSLIKVRNILNKMHAHLKAIDKGVAS